MLCSELAIYLLSLAAASHIIYCKMGYFTVDNMGY